MLAGCLHPLVRQRGLMFDEAGSMSGTEDLVTGRDNERETHLIHADGSLRK